jgi:glycosyltransferase involved in cell wall biosynthesis
VLATRSRPELLAEAIGSVLRQTRPDFELLVVDDASDPPASVPDDPRIRIIRVDENGGPARARNLGWDAARGRAVAFLDDDDLYTADHLELLAGGLERAPVAVCFCRYLDGAPGRHRTLEGDVGDTVLDDLIPSPGMTAVRRDVAVRFAPRWRAVEDVEWWLRLAQEHPVTTVPRIGYLFRRSNAAHEYNGLDTRVAENIELLDEYADWFAAHPHAAAFRLKRAGLIAMHSGDPAAARRAFVRSLRVEPRADTAWHVLRATARGATTRWRAPVPAKAPT